MAKIIPFLIEKTSMHKSFSQHQINLWWKFISCMNDIFKVNFSSMTQQQAYDLAYLKTFERN